jgi:hypothetical protein
MNNFQNSQNYIIEDNFVFDQEKIEQELYYRP